MLTTTQSYVQYQGNGVTTVFPYNFPIPAAGDLVVSVTNNNVSPAVSTVLQATQYSVTGIGNATGGNVTYGVGSPLPIGWTITIQRVVPYLQNTSLTNQGALYPQVVEAALDYLTMLAQQLSDSPIVGTNPGTLATLIASFAPLVSPAFTGAPTAPTQPPGDASTKIATNAFVAAAIAAFAPSGVWTPGIAFGGGSTGITYNGQQFGEYQVCGKLVTCGFSLTLTNKGTSTGPAVINGLPFTVGGISRGGNAIGYDINMSGLSGPILLNPTSSTNTAFLDYQGATGGAFIMDTNFTNTSSIQGLFQYFIA